AELWNSPPPSLCTVGEVQRIFDIRSLRKLWFIILVLYLLTQEVNMFKVIAVYRVPDDEAAKAQFEEHFSKVHTPICLRIPGIRELRVNKIFGGPAGASNLHMIAEMCFENKDAWKTAMKTPEMMESGKDAMKF